MRLRWRLMGAILLILLLMAGCGLEGEAWERIEEEGILRVGLDPTFPPFESVEGTELAGLDVDLARALANELGLEAAFAYFGYDGLYDALATEQVDVLISAMIIVPERTRDFAYSTPYFNAGEILVVSEASAVEGMAELAGKVVAVELGAQGHVEAMQWAKRLPNLTVAPYASADEALGAVAAGEADAAVVDGVSGRLYLSEQPEVGLWWVEEPVTVEPYAMVVRIEDEVLLSRLDEALAALIESGELNRLSERWLGR